MSAMAPSLLLMILPVAIAGAILALVGGRGMSVFKKQGVAWGLTVLMIVAAIGIGYGKAHASSVLESPPASATIPPASAMIPPVSSSRSYVRDDAGVLSDTAVQELDRRNQRLYEDYGVVIGVVTCNYGRDNLYNYALKQAEEMDLRDSDFIVVLDIGGDNYWLVQGAGLVNIFTDEDCSDYAWNYMEQAFAGGDYDGAVLKLTVALWDWYSDYFN